MTTWKRRGTILAALVLGCFVGIYASSITTAGGGGGSQINLVQANVVRGNPATTLTFFNNVASGDLLIFCGGWTGSTAANPTATDTVGTTYSLIVGTNGHASANAACFAGPAGGSGANTITVVWPASSSDEGIYVSEYVGVSTTVDGTGSVFNSIPLALQITTSAVGDLVTEFSDTNAAPTLSCVNMTTVLTFELGLGAGINCTSIQNAAGLISGGILSSSPSSNNATVLFALKHS
jgi:hypothetical protein